MWRDKSLSLLIGVAMLSAIAWADVPGRINYQGYMTSSSGAPVDGSFSVAFAIYDAPVDGTVLWSETQTIDVIGGQFSVELGKTQAITASVFDDTTCWLGLTVGGDAEHTPRARLLTAAYAFRVSTIDGAKGGVISGDATILGKVSIGPGNYNSGINSLVAGESDTPSGDRSTVTGGLQNVASGQTSVISGGYLNKALGISASVSGGNENHADWHFAHVGGGLRNVSTSWASTVGGGEADSAMGQWSTVPGGAVNKAVGDYSFAFGRRAKALHYGTLVWGDGEDADFNSTAPNQFLIRSHGGVGINTNAPSEPLEVGGIIYSNSGGFKFPDGTIQTTASGAGSNAETVDGFHAFAYAQPNALLALDGSSNFVMSGSTLTGLIRGSNTAGPGVHGRSDESIGVLGECMGTGNPAATAYGVRGYATNAFTGDVTGGDFAAQPGGTGNHCGITAWSNASNALPSRGVYANAVNGGTGDALGGDIVAHATGSGGTAGVAAYAVSDGAGIGQAFFGWAQTGGTGDHYGARLFADGGARAYGIWAQASGGSTANWAGYFNGNVNVVGTLSKGGGSFKIDHPLDPANKYLYHSFVESPDMKNIYDGVILLDAQGQATVELPPYFEALNREFRYQLTCVGAYSPVYVSKKITDNRFVIAGGVSGLEVSWQVTGVRKDAFAQAHRIPVEEMKTDNERGKYLYPTEQGQPASLSIDGEPNQPSSTGR